MTGVVTIISRHFKIFIPIPPSSGPDTVCTGYPLLLHHLLSVPVCLWSVQSPDKSGNHRIRDQTVPWEYGTPRRCNSESPGQTQPLHQVICKNLQHFFKGQHLFSLLCYTSILFHIIRYGQAKDKDTGKKKKRRKVRRRNAVPPSANGVSIPVMKV